MSLQAVAADAARRFYAICTPPPISSVFKTGGALAGWNEELTLLALCLGVLGVVDILRPAVFKNPKSRYFVLHVVANAIISVACWPDLLRAAANPIASLVGPSLSALPIAAIAAIHLYHVLFFKLTADDIFHHVQFVVPLWFLGVVFKHDGGASSNWASFFICGLPGGLNYAALTAVKEGWIKPLEQKRFDALINIYVRAPGTAVYAFLEYQVWAANVRPTRGWSPASINFFNALVVLLVYWNGAHFADQSIGNYYAHAEREKGGQREKPKGAGGEESEDPKRD